MVTIYDVAKAAGVSHTTVSRIINQDSAVPIKEETRTRVLAIIKELNYQPNLAARQLRMQRTNCLGFILCERMLNHQYYYCMLRAVEREVAKKGLNLLFATYRYPAELPNFLKQRSVDGILLTGRITAEYIEKISKVKIPFVILGSFADKRHEVNIVADSMRENIEKATSYLLSLGHNEIAYISDFREPLLVYDIMEGYKSAYDKFGLQADKNLVFTEVEDAFSVIKDLFNRRPSITALILQQHFNKDLSFYLKERKLKVPEDLSVIFCGDGSLNFQERSFYHYISSDQNEIAKAAIKHIVSCPQNRVNICIPTYFHIGKSVKELRSIKAEIG